MQLAVCHAPKDGLNMPKQEARPSGQFEGQPVRGPVHIEPKGWGREIWISNNALYCGKILEISRGKRCSLHFHKLKTESFYLRSGRLRIRIKESRDAEAIREFELCPGECMDIPPGLVHQMEAIEDSELYEFSTQHFETDSYRLVRGD
ncbi:MAG: cupin domain-containing protein [Candidatus Binataceae bacterium]